MSLLLNEKEKKILLTLQQGVSEVRYYTPQNSNQITVVTFVLKNGSVVTINTKPEWIKDRFEVVTISVSDSPVDLTPFKTLQVQQLNDVDSIFLLLTTDWIVHSSDSEKKQMLGDPEGATTQYGGLPSEVPANAINQATFVAGFEIISKEGLCFYVVNGYRNPWTLLVTGEESNEPFDRGRYEREFFC